MRLCEFFENPVFIKIFNYEPVIYFNFKFKLYIKRKFTIIRKTSKNH
jgi:hypothetical protein